ncbi:XdhC family aldehyde oxidoreductase maturation factor [Desulfobacula sp.]|uniref:XdhC family aldehyde oxidoreductase maturation factor n=1 Tax=Desulfobacula sp. TaxID=2593537 RepID=UPI0025BAD781|nr:XdhC/CoxI family protein [Desulfobacula sp.]MBC2703048.1 XdhC family protein [Desulfobacula sp.]
MGEKIYIKVYELLSSGQKLVLAKTIRRSGSTPRDVGSMCIITQDGKLIGTVGGGALEYRVQKRAVALLKQEKSFIYQFHLTNEDLAGAGMICGGDVDLYLEPLFPENAGMVSLFETIKQQIADNRPGILVTRIENGIHAMDTGARVFIKEGGKTFGTIPGLNPKEINLDKNIPYDLINLDDKGMDLFVEKIALDPRIFLFGAGHVSLFVARLAKTVGFSITLIDDRPEFANKKRFPEADKILITDFKQAFEQLEISQNSYILIITRGHLHDKTVLQHALGTNASYIGMIGSTKKRNTIYKALMDEGFSKDDLEKVYSPIGVDINAETPEEIAVSIVGELIKKRAPEKKTKNLIL